MFSATVVFLIHLKGRKTEKAEVNLYWSLVVGHKAA